MREPPYSLGCRRIKHKGTYPPIENPANKHLIGKSRRTTATNVIMACQNGAGNLSYIRRVLNLYVQITASQIRLVIRTKIAFVMISLSIHD